MSAITSTDGDKTPKAPSEKVLGVIGLRLLISIIALIGALVAPFLMGILS